MSDRIELARAARVRALDDATPPAEQSADWARQNGARTASEATSDVRRIWRDDRGVMPATTATVHGRRTMTSAVPSAIDTNATDDQGSYALLVGLTGDERGAVRADVRPSGATRHIGRSAVGELLAHHETRARRSRKGRTTFDTLRHHRRPRPVTSEPSGLDGLDSLGLIEVADALMRAAGVDPADVSGRVADGARQTYLLGTDGASMQWAEKVRDDQSAVDAFNVAQHHAFLMDPFPRHARATYGRNVILVVHGHRGVVHAGAVRPAGSMRASWRPSVWHAPERIAESVIDAPTARPEVKLAWPTRARIRGSIRAAERAQGWTRVAPGQYVRRPSATGYAGLAMRALTPTVVLSWHADVRRETAHPATIVRDERGRAIDRRRARVAVGASEPTHAWHGHALTVRPSAVSGKGRTADGTARKRAADSARDTVPADAPTMTDDEATAIVAAAIAAGTLTIVPRSQGRLSVTHRRADGTTHSWRARSVRAVAARIAQ